MDTTDLTIFGGLALNTLAIVAGVFVSLRNSKKIQEVHVSVNGKMAELVETTRKLGRSEGLITARDSQAIEAAAVIAKAVITAAEAAAATAAVPPPRPVRDIRK